MAWTDKIGSERRALYGTADSGAAVIAVAALIAIFGGLFTRWAPAMLVTLVIYVGAVGGFVYGGYRVQLSHEWVAKRCNAQATDFEGLADKVDFKEGNFLWRCAAAIGLYIAFYAWAMISLAGTKGAIAPTNVFFNWPVPEFTVFITSFMLFVSAAASVRYAAYMRLATMLKAALDASKPDKLLIGKLRKAVFSREQLYEPPGNLFVTLGITATFLGLAMGLVSLDLMSFFPRSGETVAENAARSAKAIGSLKGFVGCMGLALGLSMIGVLNAMFAQWLRGYGPSESTDQLLQRAADRLGS